MAKAGGSEKIPKSNGVKKRIMKRTGMHKAKTPNEISSSAPSERPGLKLKFSRKNNSFVIKDDMIDNFSDHPKASSEHVTNGGLNRNNQ